MTQHSNPIIIKIIGQDLQIALGMDISYFPLKWDRIVIPIRTQNTHLSSIDNRVKNLGNLQDVFATVSTPMSIHCDASDYQLGSGISQERHPYSAPTG
jgi:hypothetical protein